MRSAIFLLLYLLPIIPMAASSQSDSLPTENKDSSTYVLSNDTNDPKKVKKASATKSKKMLAFERNLLGTWITRSYSSESPDGIRTISISYQFSADNSFTKTVVYPNSKEVSNGQWTIAKDGKTLFLKTPTTKLKVSIKYLELDEMVLEQELQIDPAKKDFHFTKR